MITTTQILIWISGVLVIVGSASWIILRYIVVKSLSGIEKAEQKITSLELKVSLQAQSISHLQSDIIIIKDTIKENNGVMNKLNDTIVLFDSNMRSWHADIRAQNAEIKQSMDRSNQLVEGSTKINNELMGVLKELKNK